MHLGKNGIQITKGGNPKSKWVILKTNTYNAILGSNVLNDEFEARRGDIGYETSVGWLATTLGMKNGGIQYQRMSAIVTLFTRELEFLFRI